jgi:hypothetical protein
MRLCGTLDDDDDDDDDGSKCNVCSVELTSNDRAAPIRRTGPIAMIVWFVNLAATRHCAYLVFLEIHF